MENLVLGRKATEKEVEALKKAQEILDAVGLELIGSRPKDR